MSRIIPYDSQMGGRGLDIGSLDYMITRYLLPNKRIAVGVSEGGHAWIRTRVLATDGSRKIIVHEVGYTCEAVTCILAGLFEGRGKWVKQQKGNSYEI